MCLAIDASFEVLNPNNFTYFPAAYIDEIKTIIYKITIGTIDEYLPFENFENSNYIEEEDLPKMITIFVVI